MSAFETTTIAAIEQPNGWSPIRRELNIRAFGINAWTAAEAGGRIIPEHDEEPSGHEEAYVVVAGRATFTVNGETIDAPAGTIVFVRDPAAKRSAEAAEAGTTVLSVGGEPGAAFEPRAWESMSEVLPLFDAGDYEGVKRVLLDTLDRYEADRQFPLYNLACAEAQLGETDAALEHLAAAVALQPDMAEMAREDTDLEPIRGDPRFPS